MAFNAFYGALLFALSLLSASLAFTPYFDFGTDKVRGVNLGGWLVLEPWITPSLFQPLNSSIIDELTFCKYQESTKAIHSLQSHWDTWINETDFQEIQKAGLNHVRIPIGYWAFEKVETEPYIQGQLFYLDRAIEWASKYGLKVIINLHGVPASQNGFDNSGQTTTDPSWYRSQSNVDVTRNVLRDLVSRYDTNPVVTAISVLNEPLAPDDDPSRSQMLGVLRQFYYDSYEDIRHPHNVPESNTAIIYSDAFLGLEYWKDQQFMSDPGHEGVIMDIHKYQIFSDQEAAMTDEDHIKTACHQDAELEKTKLWAIVGEWTPAATDCATHLNGRFRGSRYDGTYDDKDSARSCEGLTGNAQKFSPSYKKFLGEYWEAQASMYERAGVGWIQWTWKTESADEWSYKAGLENKWIKRIPATRSEGEQMYPDVEFCNRQKSAARRRFTLLLEVNSYVGLLVQAVVVFCIQGFLL